MSVQPIITTGIRAVGRSLVGGVPLKALNQKGQEMMVTYVGEERVGKTDSRIRTLVKPVMELEIPQDESVVVRCPNPFTVNVEGKATEIFTSQNAFGMLASKGKHRGFHGTSLGTLIRYGIDQVAQRSFNVIGQRIYFDSVGTAIEYALEENYYDEKMGWYGATREVRQGTPVKLEDGREAIVLELPVVLAISSNETPKENDPVKDPGLFKYHYFSGNEPVYIDGMWLLHHNLSNERMNEHGAIKDDIGIGSARRTAAMALRQVSGVVKYY